MANQTTEVASYVYRYPTKLIKTHSPFSEITIGDLHGNAMKLVSALVTFGILEIEKEDYLELVKIYKKPVDELQKEDIEKFKALVDALKPTDFKPLVRLIGDDFADRGQNDLFTLIVLEKLQKTCNYESLFSNHGLEFIYHLEFSKAGCFSDRKRLSINDEQSCSLNHLCLLIEKGIVTEEEVREKIHQYYLKKLKLISYSIDEQSKNFTLYTHAPIDYDAIRFLAKKLEVSYKDDSIASLKATIDAINNTFQTYVAQRTINELYDKDTTSSMQDENQNNEIKQKDPLRYIAWNALQPVFPADLKGFSLTRVYGHTMSVDEDENSIGIDDNYGKKSCDLFGRPTGDSDRLDGYYPVLFTPTHSLKAHENFYNTLQLLKHKVANALFISKEGKAIPLEIENLWRHFSQKISNESYRHFYDEAKKLIGKLEPELKNCIEMKCVLKNLTLCILGLGVFYGFATLINKAVNGKFLFFSQPESVQHTSELNQLLERNTSLRDVNDDSFTLTKGRYILAD